ncbi:MAG: DoxX family protein [Chlorobi bacterium]|nr:DoxX family protein [Chlorobiota bacterium]
MLKHISRILIGLLFLFSGFVKAVDPVGGSIKLTDYFEAFGMDFMISMALPLAILLSTIEFITGFHLLTGIRVKLFSYVAFYMIAFFTVLTFFLAIFNPVSDCGCFGDAIKLTNWQTFYKNLIALPFAWIIFRDRTQFSTSISSARINIITLISVIFATGISIYSYLNLPPIDFRPFKTGTNISEAMKIPEGAPQAEYKTTFILEKDGIRKEFNENNYPYEDTTWQFIDSKSILVKEGYQPPIKDFYLSNNADENMTNTVLNSKFPVFLMTVPDITTLNKKNVSELINISNKCRKNKIQFYCVTSSLMKDIVKFESKHRAMFNYLFADEVLIKTINRGNPGLTVLNKGTILAKYNYFNLPSSGIVNNPLSYTIKESTLQKEKRFVIITALLLILTVTVLYRKH